MWRADQKKINDTLSIENMLQSSGGVSNISPRPGRTPGDLRSLQGKRNGAVAQ
jgi:hypothetical protein